MQMRGHDFHCSRVAPPSSPFNGILERSHNIAIFAFFFRYFSSTRPNEFFQIQAYLIHRFRLLALLFSPFAAERQTIAGAQPSPSLQRVIHRTDKIRRIGNVIVLNKDCIAFVFENIGYFLRDGGGATTPTNKKINFGASAGLRSLRTVNLR
jgi:hypothetical protein